jgi:hypothetical protein
MRLPKTIWVYTFIDLWRVILLSTAVLVIVIAFASTVRHTAEGKLDPLATLRFMLYAMPPMLQYALPFAAGFGATLAFHRMVQDNEITAASAGGVSHRAVLFPALVSGLIIAGTLSFLSGQVIPRFLRSMEQMITLDATKFLMNSIRSGQPVEFDGRIVLASSVYPINPPPEGASDQLVLSDVSAIEVDDRGKVISESFARRAWLIFYRSPLDAPDDPVERPGRTLTKIVMNLENSQRYRDGEGLTQLGSATLVHPIATGLRDDPKFLTTKELAELPSHPDRYGDINQFRRGLALTVVERLWLRTIDQTLRRDRRIQLLDADGREHSIAAGGLEFADGAWRLLPPAPGKDIEVQRSAPRSRTREPATRLVAASATLAPEPDRGEVLREVRLSLRLQNVAGQAQEASEAAGVKAEFTCPGLVLPDNSQRAILGLPSLKLLDFISEQGLLADPGIAPVAADLRTRIINLGRHVLSKQHERAANVAASVVMVLAGAVTALRLGASLPLTVYLWSFFPAVLTMITISAGQQATRGIGPAGLVVLWGAVAMLVAYTGLAYWFVRRH